MADKEMTIKQKKPNEFIVDEKDNAGDSINRIYYKSPDYVVYRTEGAIRIDFDDESTNLEKYSANTGKIAVELARIYSWMPEKLSWSEPINRQIARSLSENAKGNDEAAKQMLLHAESRIKMLKTINGRLQYTISGYVVALVVFVVMLVLNIYAQDFQSSVGVYYEYSKIALCGALGGILSVSLGFPKLTIDIDANFLTNCLVGASRLVISVSAAVFSYFALKSGIAFSFLANDELKYGIYVVAMISGFSEMLIPNMMSNFSGSIEEDSKQTQT